MGSTLSTAHRLEFRRALYLSHSNNKIACSQNAHLRRVNSAFFELRKPKISSCYTTSKTNEAVHKTYWTAPLILLCDVHYNFSP